MQWHAKSPDLSWIETLWGDVSKQLSKRLNLAKRNFTSEVLKAWDNIPESVHSNIYNSIKSRPHACIDACGVSTKYQKANIVSNCYKTIAVNYCVHLHTNIHKRNGKYIVA